ncbi:PPK2 family polyphosphate kinase [Acidipropionibacterium timonense]|uniref:PPK2 family polyphosphate kinase n=1 Tax=Acidipropionibacterium timonense TaxID=2161818 RepID=UPI001032778F|nr:PPK2 family polyphosphate kinase [Acidipropionibacterium timonense]
MSKKNEELDLCGLLRCPQRPVNLAAADTAATPGAPGDKEATAQDVATLADELSDLQERLFARGKDDPEHARRLLVVLQGLDTAGKGGVVRHTLGLVDPQGIHLKAFKAPTPEEREHDFLWRIRKDLPEAGMIGVFDRSHYEDVLIARVDHLVEDAVWQGRYDIINDFEAELAASGTRIIKCFLHVSKDVQKERLAARLEDPAKYWKYNPSDLDTRSKWDDYTAAYTDLLERCNPDIAPWYVVPADHKWYRNWAVARLMLETMRSMNLTWPPAEFDVKAEQEKVAAA